MKYKGIELEGLDKDVKLAHSRFTEADEGTDWIDKLLTCDKAALSSMPAPPSSGPIRSSCSWRTGTRRVQRTRASGATRSMARRCTSKMVASSSTRWQEGHPRGCPSPYGGVCVRYV